VLDQGVLGPELELGQDEVAVEVPAQDGFAVLVLVQDELAVLELAALELAAWELVAWELAVLELAAWELVALELVEWELVDWELASLVVDHYFRHILVADQDLLVEKDFVELVAGLEVEQVVVPVLGLVEELELVHFVLLVPQYILIVVG